MNTAISQWIRKTAGKSLNAISAKIDMPQATLSKQVRENKIKPETVVAIARAYNANPLEGLEALGLLTKKDLREYQTVPDWHKVTDRELLDEIERRLLDGTATEELAAGDSEPAQENKPPHVRPARPKPKTPTQDDLTLAASEKPQDYDPHMDNWEEA